MSTISADRRFYLDATRAMLASGFNCASIATKLGTSAGTINTYRAVLTLPADVQSAFATYQLTCGAVATLAGANRHGEFAATWARIKRTIKPATTRIPDAAVQPSCLLSQVMNETSNPTVRDTLGWVLGLRADPPA